MSTTTNGEITLVGAPGESFLTDKVDAFTNSSVQKVAKWSGWPGAREGKDSTKSAIAWLERNYPVNYDFGTSSSTGNAVKNMTLKNHHLKSLGHSPDIIGLLFSILDQFNNTASFIDKGHIVVVKGGSNDQFELQGSTLVAKIFAGFCNWFMHLMSDVAGSSGAAGRGSGIPIPFYNLLTFLNVGAFGQDNHSLATIFTKVFEEGYDARHGAATAIPPLVTELLIRVLYTVKRRYYHKFEWKDCVPSASVPELRRMLFVGYGILCTGDAIDAFVKSGGELILFLKNTNLTAWVRFGTLAYKELIALVKQGHIDVEKIDRYIEGEYRDILRNLQ
ncbi:MULTISPECIES: hypothetical protein [unclassified Desulfovibrio]|uniref:hypothetical protein n=1 Tax=unclassified Desulfovibrio TaxID=2593640 RepID=UPI000F603EE4|nr:MULTISPECIES: hypothetical protein [unclassified Desulfovibrio]RRD69271.1 hypothetical protein EII24_10705 [Desulfovibrio sp. OH1209_COT-279]RRD85731.1 hypothetical protein EII23_10705 [Desulfovibrio sp. OH1186_COT-070]